MSSINNVLRVPKAKIDVEILLQGKDSRRVEVFITGAQRETPRRLKVLELLDQDELFIPTHDITGDEWILFSKEALLLIAIDLKADDPELEKNVEVELFDKKFGVQVQFSDGSSLEGDLLFSPPATGRRVVDHLNRPDRFFSLFQKDRIFLINKTAVVAVIERRVNSGESIGKN